MPDHHFHGNVLRFVQAPVQHGFHKAFVRGVYRAYGNLLPICRYGVHLGNGSILQLQNTLGVFQKDAPLLRKNHLLRSAVEKLLPYVFFQLHNAVGYGRLRNVHLLGSQREIFYFTKTDKCFQFFSIHRKNK